MNINVENSRDFIVIENNHGSAKIFSEALRNQINELKLKYPLMNPA